jgi:2-methoxy-6-polyprenyl-1,4-benzoquinol methylase
VESLNPAPHLQHIDVAGGTGDVAFRVVRAMRAAAAAARNQPPAPQYQAPGHQHQQQRHRQQQEESPSTSGQQQHQQQHSQQQPGSSQYGSSDPRDSSGWVTVCDINPDMLAVGQQRAAQQGE